MTLKKLLPRLHSDNATVGKNKQKVYNYLQKKTHWKRRSAKVPMQLSVLTIAKACGLTYSQCRYGIKLLLKEKKIEKWTVYNRPAYKATFYRTVDNLPRPPLL